MYSLSSKALLSSFLFVLLSFSLHQAASLWEAGGSLPGPLLTYIYIGMASVYIYSILFFTNSDESSVFWIIIAGAVVSRFVLVFAPTVLTTDIPRYIWEGKVVRAGLNPYLHAPGSESLALLRDLNWQRVEYKSLSAIYPPAAQYLFGVFAVSEIAWKLSLFCAECLSLFFLSLTIKNLKLPAGRIAYYAFLPLALIEIPFSGHLEGFVVLGAALMIRAAVRIKAAGGRGSKAAFLFALVSAFGVLIKYVLLFPFAVFLADRKNPLHLCDAVKTALFTAIFVLIFSLPYLLEPLSLFNSLNSYLLRWRFNDSLFHLLGWISGVDWRHSETMLSIKYILAAFWLTAVLIMIVKKMDCLSICLFGFLLLLLLSPVVHPWYGLWLAPLLCFRRSVSALVLLVTLPISYYSLLYGDNSLLPIWIKAVEYIPVYLILSCETTGDVCRRYLKKPLKPFLLLQGLERD